MPAYAISSWSAAPLSPNDAIAALAAAGFRRVELSDDASPLVRAWEADPVAVTADLAAAGLTVDSVHTPEPGRFLDLPDAAARQASIQANLDYFDLMTAAGVPEMVVHPISNAAGLTAETLAAAQGRVRDSLAQLADAAGEHDLRLGVENLGANEELAGSLASLLSLIDGLGSHVGLCHDIGHTVQAGLDPVAEVELALRSGRLFSLHLHDVNAEKRDHYIPGEAALDFAPYLAALAAHSFAGLRTLEIAPGRGDTTERLRLAAAVRYCWEALP
ncbi:MAG: sugar phosphate isomerase/epimerase [Armatimonadetes bacterium]|nr:sugar phosphate isomerase/epimerase [Armatimonadota bacterium]